MFSGAPGFVNIPTKEIVSVGLTLSTKTLPIKF